MRATPLPYGHPDLYETLLATEELRCRWSSVTVESSIHDATGEEVASAAAATETINAGRSVEIEQNGTVPNPEIWSVDSPTMYSVVTTLSVDGDVVDRAIVQSTGESGRISVSAISNGLADGEVTVTAE
jgi:beta-galactosidase/beta-glucuronidase